MCTLRRQIVQSLMAIVTITTAPVSCFADVIYQSDFEQPSFTPGLLEGQDGWRNLWNSGPAMITDVQPKTRVQSIQMDGDRLKRISGGGLVGTAFEWPVNFDPVENNLPIINIRADVRLDGPSTHPDDLISANLSARTNGNRIIADLLLSSSEDVWGPSVKEPVVLGQYYNLGLRLDYENQEYEYFLNGNSLEVHPMRAQFAEQDLTTVTLELLAVNDAAVIDPGEYTAYFDNLIITVGDDFPPPFGVLLPGDANQDLSFDQLDLVQVAVAGKFLTGEHATWGEGDWDRAPGGEPGNPPAGDGMFNQLDIISALSSGVYLTGLYGAILAGGSDEGDGQTSIVYDPGTGAVSIDVPAGMQVTSINIDSASGVFTGDSAHNLGGSFDNDADANIFKATFGSSFGSLSFGNVAQTGLSADFVLGDLTVVGSLASGGDLGNVDLVYVPEPASVLLLSVGLAIGLVRFRRVNR